MNKKIILVAIILFFGIFPINNNVAQFPGNTPCDQCQSQLNHNAYNLEQLHFIAVFNCTPLSGPSGGFLDMFGFLQALYDAATGSGGVSSGTAGAYGVVSATLFSIADSYNECVSSANYQFGVGLNLLSDTYCNCMIRNDCGGCIEIH